MLSPPEEIFQRRNPTTVVLELLVIVVARGARWIQRIPQAIEINWVSARPLAVIQLLDDGLDRGRDFRYAESTVARPVDECRPVKLCVALIAYLGVITLDQARGNGTIPVGVDAKDGNFRFTIYRAPRRAPPLDCIGVCRYPGKCVDSFKICVEVSTGVPIEAANRPRVKLVAVLEKLLIVNLDVSRQLTRGAMLDMNCD